MIETCKTERNTPTMRNAVKGSNEVENVHEKTAKIFSISRHFFFFPSRIRNVINASIPKEEIKGESKCSHLIENITKKLNRHFVSGIATLVVRNANIEVVFLFPAFLSLFYISWSKVSSYTIPIRNGLPFTFVNS